MCVYVYEIYIYLSNLFSHVSTNLSIYQSIYCQNQDLLSNLNFFYMRNPQQLFNVIILTTF